MDADSVEEAIPFGPGDTVSATFDRIGSVSVTFAGQERPSAGSYRG